MVSYLAGSGTCFGSHWDIRLHVWYMDTCETGRTNVEGRIWNQLGKLACKNCAVHSLDFLIGAFYLSRSIYDFHTIRRSFTPNTVLK